MIVKIIAALCIVLLLPVAVLAASITLGWDLYTQGSDMAVSIRIYRENPSTGVCNGMWLAYGEVTVSTTSFVDSALSSGQTYCYKLRAVDSAGTESADSNVVRFLVPTGAPTPPSNLHGTIGP